MEELNGEGPVVYDVALPFASGPLTLDDNEALYLMKLDALMPSLALRPFIQEGYLVGDELISKSVKDISQSDLRRRVIASFRLRGSRDKWLNDIGISPESLMVEDDDYSSITRKVKDLVEKPSPTSGDIDEVLANMAEALALITQLMKYRAN